MCSLSSPRVPSGTGFAPGCRLAARSGAALAGPGRAFGGGSGRRRRVPGVSRFLILLGLPRSTDAASARLARCARGQGGGGRGRQPVSYTHLRAHETKANLVCRLLLEKKKK